MSARDAATALVEAALRDRRLREFRCQNATCGRVLFEYEPPVGEVLVRCRRCGLYSSLTTTKAP